MPFEPRRISQQREPVILCYLECMTRDEAAKQLGLSSTTMYGRLECGRNLLRAQCTAAVGSLLEGCESDPEGDRISFQRR
jgi:DNA-directed RNA polymerase specialized sigma24 family protein